MPQMAVYGIVVVVVAVAIICSYAGSERAWDEKTLSIVPSAPRQGKVGPDQ